jgi:predicted site-specific integrase-resolvase
MTKQKTIIELQKIINVARKTYREFRDEGKLDESRNLKIKIRFLESKVEEILKANFSVWSESIESLASQISDIQTEVSKAISDVQSTQDKFEKFVKIVGEVDKACKVAYDIVGRAR